MPTVMAVNLLNSSELPPSPEPAGDPEIICFYRDGGAVARV